MKFAKAMVLLNRRLIKCFDAEFKFSMMSNCWQRFCFYHIRQIGKPCSTPQGWHCFPFSRKKAARSEGKA
jgi:hypothetical protein